MVHEQEMILTESFIFTYGKLKKLKILNSLTVYTSNKLSKLVHEMFIHSSFKNSIKYIEPLLENKSIIPATFTKSHFSLLIPKLLDNILDAAMVYDFMKYRGTLGFYTPIDNKIYLLLTNSTNLFGWINDENIADLMAHEMMHYCAANKLNDFYRLWKPIFVKYYMSFIKTYINLVTGFTISKKLENKLSHYYSKIYIPFIMKNDGKFLKNVNSYYKKLLNLYSEKSMLYKILTEEFDNNTVNVLLYNLYYIVKLGIQNPFKIPEYPPYEQIYYALIDAYKTIKFNSRQSQTTLPYQELLFPSEISAISITSKNARYLFNSSLKLLDL